MTLRVWVNDRPVGRLDRHGRGTTFVYDRDVDPADAVSLTMPVRTASYDSPWGLLPVFDTNLPEGILRHRIETSLAKAHGRVDPIGILRLTGRNQIGRIRVLPENEGPVRQTSAGNIDELLERKATQALVDEMMNRYAAQSGVSGAMPKVLVHAGPGADAGDRDAREHRHTIPTRDYILKFDAEDYPGLSLNEFFCLEAARAAGNVTARARLGTDGRMLAVRRFDGEDGRRPGFEDLASLNARTARDKYSGSMERDLFRRVGEFSGDRRRENLESLFKLCVTNIALRNGDAHLKNFALLFEDADRGPFALAPAYDLVTTTAWVKADMMALTLGGSKRWPKPGAVRQLGARAGLSPKGTRDIVAEVGAGLRAVMPAMIEAFEAQGQGELGRRVAASWNEGLMTSLGEEPGSTAAAPSVKQAGERAADTVAAGPPGAEEGRSLPEPSPSADPTDPFGT